MNASANLNLVQHPRTQATSAANTIAPADTSATTTATNGSKTESLASNDGHRTPNVEHLSKTNLYIRGLQPNTNDQDLYNLCVRFGQICSTKAILDKSTGCCRGKSDSSRAMSSR